MDLVAVDIGGTHARFSIATIDEGGAITLSEPQTLHTHEHAGFHAAWEDFRRCQGGALPRAISMAIAGRVGDPRDPQRTIRFTNNPWVIRPAEVHGHLGIEHLTIVNDFEAVAHAVARAGDEEFIHLSGPDKPLAATGRLSVLGPGTGLGVAHLYREPGGAYRVSATEGGHIGFAPLDPVEDAILARLRERHDRVSVERVVAGPAICDIYQALAEIEGEAVREEDDITIWTRGLDRSDSLAAAAVERFCMCLGSVAGDIALAQGGFGGVAIAGGLGYRMRETLLASGFAERFQAKGRFQELMAAVPVKLIIQPQPGLFGAAAAFASEHLGGRK